MIIDNLPTIPSAVTTGDELPVERGTTTYKVDYNALETAILDKVLRQPATPVVFGGSENAFSANIATLLDSMTPGESRTISTYVDVGTDNFAAYASYYGTLYKIHDLYATGILTDNARSVVLIGRSNSDTVYFNALAKAAVVPVGVGGTGATTAEQAVANLGIGAFTVGTNLTPSIPNEGANTVVSTMTLNRGKYIIMASGWSPLGGPSTAQSTSFFIGGWGSTSLTWSFNLAVIVVVDSDNTVIEGRVMNWEPNSFAQASTDYTMRAIKIA